MSYWEGGNSSFILQEPTYSTLRIKTLLIHAFRLFMHFFPDAILFYIQWCPTFKRRLLNITFCRKRSSYEHFFFFQKLPAWKINLGLSSAVAKASFDINIALAIILFRDSCQGLSNYLIKGSVSKRPGHFCGVYGKKKEVVCMSLAQYWNCRIILADIAVFCIWAPVRHLLG